MLRQSLKFLLLAFCFIAVTAPEANAQAGVPAGGCQPVIHRNWVGCVPTPGVAIPFCTVDARSGVQGIKYLTQEGYDKLIAIGSIRACGAAPSCTQSTQQRTQACPSGQSGIITEQRTICVGGDPLVNTNWTPISNTCTSTCTPGTETRNTTPCPSGQTGVITEQRQTNVGGVCGTYGTWNIISNTCTPVVCTPGTETRNTTPCPSGQSGVITEQRTTNTGGVCGVYGNWTVTSNTCTPGLVCTTPWGQQLNSGQSVTAYYTQNVGQGQTCVSETRTCTNGNLSGSFLYQSCGQTCTATTEDRTVPCPTGETGVGIIERRTVNQNGVCGSNSNWAEVTRACEPIVCALPWGGQILYGQSVTAYQASSAATCVSQTRTCGANGLTGTYTYQNCTQTCTQQTETRTSTPCPSGQTGVITETRTINTGGVCGQTSAWTTQSNTCQPTVSTCDITLAAGSYINLNLYQLAQQHQCPIVPGVRVTLTILEGAIIGSNSYNYASFTTGTGWPSNVTLRVFNRGRIIGKGGDGAYAWLDGSTPRVTPAQAGGPAVDAPHPMTFDNSDGEIWGGGGGGGTINYAHCSPAGGGGAGYVIGNTFIPYMECSVNGSASREGKRLNGEIATRTTGAGNEYMIRQIGSDVNAAYYVSGPGGHPGQAGGNAAFYVRTQHVAALGTPSVAQDIIIGYYYYTPTQIGGTQYNTGALIGGDAGNAIVNPQNVTFTGADNGDRRGKDYPTTPPRRPTPQPPLTDLTCTATTETRTTTQCPAGQAGVITEQRTVNVGNVCGANGNWTIVSNTCTPTCTQGTETRTSTQCPSGQQGTITEVRTTNVNGQCGVNGNWTVTSNTCQPVTQETVLLLAKPKTVSNGQVTAWDYYPYCTNHYAAIGLEFNPNLPYKVDVVLLTGSQDGRLGNGCGNTGDTGRLKFAEIPLVNVQTGNTFSLTAKFYAQINGCGYSGNVSSRGYAERTVTINVDKSKYVTSYVNFVYDTNGNQVTGEQAANAIITQIPCIPYADFTGRAAAGLFGLCSANGTQNPGYIVLADKYVTIQ